MFDIGWSEFLVIAVVTLIVVGPKQMPILLRAIGRYVGMAKRQAAEFQRQFDEAVKEAELDDIKDEVTSLRSDFETTMEETNRAVKKEYDEAHEGVKDAAKIAEREDLVSSESAPASPTLNENSPAQTGDK